MYNATKTETEILIQLKKNPLTKEQLAQALKNLPPSQFQNALEGCLAKNYITLTENQKYALTTEGKNQV